MNLFMALAKEISKDFATLDEVNAAITSAINVGLTVGRRVYHESLGRGTIIAYNTSEFGFYPGTRYPVKFCRDSDGYTDVYGADEFITNLDKATTSP